MTTRSPDKHLTLEDVSAKAKLRWMLPSRTYSADFLAKVASVTNDEDILRKIANHPKATAETKVLTLLKLSDEDNLVTYPGAEPLSTQWLLERFILPAMIIGVAMAIFIPMLFKK